MDPDPRHTLEALSQAKRIMVIGQAGSGKSYLAQKLGKSLGLPVFHMDQIHWKPGWQERDPDEKQTLCQEVHEREFWVFEGGMSSTWHERLARSDVLIWIHMPFWIRFWRVLRRTVQTYGQTRADLAENCPERLSFQFYRFMWNTRHSFYEKHQTFFTNANRPKVCIQTREQMAFILRALTTPVSSTD